MLPNILFILIALVQLLAGMWAADLAFADTTSDISTIAMMGMLGSLFHSSVLIASLWFPIAVKKVIALLLLVWHIPEAVLIATLGMGIPASDQPVGIATHAGIAVFALLAWHLLRKKESNAGSPQ